MKLYRVIYYADGIFQIKMPLLTVKVAGSACAAYVFGYPVYKRIGFSSKLFGVPFMLEDLRWLPAQENS